MKKVLERKVFVMAKFLSVISRESRERIFLNPTPVD